MDKTSFTEDQNTENLTLLEKWLPDQYESLYELIGGKNNGKKLWNSISLIIGRFTASGLGFLTWLITARIYSPEEVGIASGVISSVMLCVQIALIGLNSAFISLYPQYIKNTSKLVNTAINLTMISSTITAAVFVLLSSIFFKRLDIVSNNLPYLLLFFGLSVLSTLITLLDHFSIGIRNAKQVLLRNFVFGVLTIASVALVPVVTGQAVSSGIVFGWVLASVAACLLGGYQIYQSMANFRYRFEIDFSIGKKLFQIGVQNYLLTLGERAPNWIIPIMVTELLSPEENAYWYALWMMAWVVYNIPISVGQNLFADLSHEKDDQRGSIFFSMRTSIILAGMGGLAAIILARFMLSLMGTPYAEAGTAPLRILLMGALPVTCIQSYYGVCRGTGRLNEAAIAAWVSGVLSIAAVYFISEYRGLIGIALSLLIIQLLIGTWSLLRIRSLSSHQVAKT